MTKTTASARLARAATAVVESLEARQLFSTDPLAFQSVVQPLPYSLDFTRAVNGVLDRSGQGIGLTRVQLNKLGTQYQPSLLNLNTAAGELDVTTQGTSTSGSSYGTDNTQPNALETQFDGTTTGFTITARLKGPLSQLSAAYDAGGVYFGPDQDNYVKFVAEYDATKGQTLQFTDEQSGTIHTVNLYQGIGSFSNLSTLDLRLTGDAITGRVTASYSIDGGAFVTLPQAVTLTGAELTSFFNAASRAGILTANKNDLAPITVPFSHFEIDPGISVPRPAVTTTTPGNSDMNISRAAFISADLSLPNSGLDANSLSSATVFLFRTSDHALINAVVNTSGGGDTIILQPSALLDPNTNYTFTITSGVKDTTGVSMAPYTMSFTTGTAGGSSDPSIVFQKVALNTATGTAFTSVQFGPDHKLYAASEDGRIFRYALNLDGTLGTPQIITSLQTANGGQRLVSGFTFDPASTAANPIIWISNSYYAFDNSPDFSGKLTRMSGANLETVQDVLVNLPRSIRDHLNEQPTFGPDGALYFCQGSNTAMGAPDTTWGMRSEHMLNAAILRVDVTRITPGQPLDVKTPDAGGSYNPFAPDAPLTIYASGVRNAFQLIWTADGTLYAPTNGSSAGGNTPGFPTSTNGLRLDTGAPYDGTNVPALNNLQQTEQDWLYKIQQGGYYGHPVAARGEYVLDGGNPTANVDPEEVPAYPVGTMPDPNYRGATPGNVFDFGPHRSPDGIIEYQDHTFGGLMQGKLLVAEYSGGSDIVVLTRDANGNITSAERGITGFTGFTNPVNLIEDPATGNIYVAELGGQKLTLLRPVPPHATASVNKSLFVFNDIQTASTGGAGASPAQTLTITNSGTVPLNLSGISISNDPASATQDASSFAITNLASLPSSVAPGQSVNLTVNYTASTVGRQSAILQIQTNDTSNPLLSISLHGIGTTGTGGANEPSLARILRAYNIPTIVGDGPNDSAEATTFYPTPADASSQEVLMQRLTKAGSGPVSIQLLATFVVPNQPAARFGYYAPGATGGKTELFKVNNADAQSVNPTAIGSTTFDPGSSAFGLYSVFPTFTDNGKQRVAYSEDALNTWDAAVPRKMRFFPLENADGSVVPNAYIFTAEDYNLQYDSNDVVGIIRNVQAAANAPHGPALSIENLDSLPFSDRMIFNRIQNPATIPLANGTTTSDIVHDTGTLRIHNNGDQPLVINSLSLSSPAWMLVNPPTGPVTIAANGGTLDVVVKFIATAAGPHTGNQTNDTTNAADGGVWNGTLTITSNDPLAPTKSVDLAGYWQNLSEHENEPGLQTIVNLLAGYGTRIADQLQPNYTEGTTPTYYGEEFVSAYWNAADPTLPVTVTQLAAFHSQVDSSTGLVTSAGVGWTAQGSTSTHFLYNNVPGEGQALLPHIRNTNQPATASFTPNGTFGLNLDGNYSNDAFNTVGGGGGHHVRFYPLRDRSGNLIPNAWIVGLDYGNVTFENYDFQDTLYVISNMRPANAAPSPADAQATAGAGGVTLQWGAVSDTTLQGYNVYRSTSLTGTYAKVNTSLITTTSFLDPTPAPGVTNYYRITAVDSAGESVATNVSVLACPAAPINFSATATATNRIALNWSVSTGATSYRIERQVAGDTRFVEIASGVTGNSYADTTVVGNVSYIYQIRAENSAGISPYSATASAATQLGIAPTAPTGLSASVGSSGHVTLTWHASSGIVTAYHVERAGIDGNFVEIAGSVAGTTFVDAAAAPDTFYTWRVRAENGGALSSYSGSISLQTPVAAPTNLTAAIASASQINLNWVAPSGIVTGYRLERKGPGDSAYVEISRGDSATSYSDTDVAAGAGTYSYRVRAESTGGLSAYSSVAVVDMSAPPGSSQRSAFDLGVIAAGHQKILKSLTTDVKVNYYAIVIDRQTKLTVRLSALRDNADLELRDAAGHTLMRSARPRRQAEAFTITLNPGTYYVRTNLAGTVGTAYRLDLTAKFIKPRVTHRARPTLLGFLMGH